MYTKRKNTVENKEKLSRTNWATIKNEYSSLDKLSNKPITNDIIAFSYILICDDFVVRQCPIYDVTHISNVEKVMVSSWGSIIIYCTCLVQYICSIFSGFLYSYSLYFIT